MPHTHFTKAKRHAERAIARGDLDAAERWTRIMRDHIDTARTIIHLACQRPGPKRKPKLIGLTSAQRERIAAEAQTTPAPTMPVMLDPDGYSPGGERNWVLNMKRLYRAGLPASLAPKTKSELRRAAASQHPTNS